MFVAYISADIYDELDAQLEEHGLVCECLGGGKITHNADEKMIEVGGKSQVRRHHHQANQGI